MQLTNREKCAIMGVAHLNKGKKEGRMKSIYTVSTRLYGGDQLLDVRTLQFAYRSHENASKALEDLKKEHMRFSNYKPTEDPTTLQKRGDYSDTIFTLKFVITQHYLSDYEKRYFEIED